MAAVFYAVAIPWAFYFSADEAGVFQFFRCWDTFDGAIGSTSTISPQMHLTFSASTVRIAFLLGAKGPWRIQKASVYLREFYFLCLP
jgi:hypothetical protein